MLGGRERDLEADDHGVALGLGSDAGAAGVVERGVQDRVEAAAQPQALQVALEAKRRQRREHGSGGQLVLVRRLEKGRDRQHAAGVDRARRPERRGLVVDGRESLNHRRADAGGQVRVRAAHADPHARAPAAEHVPAQAEARRRLAEVKRVADLHELVAEAGIGDEAGRERERVLDVPGGVAGAVGHRLGVEVRARRAGRRRVARLARIEEAVRVGLAVEQAEDLLAAGVALGVDEPRVLAGGAGTHDVRAPAVRDVGGDRCPVGGGVLQEARAAPEEPARRHRTRIELGRARRGARVGERLVIGQLRRDVRGQLLRDVGGGGIVRALAQEAAVPRGDDVHVGVVPFAAVGRDRVAGVARAIDAGGLDGRVEDVALVVGDLAEQRDLDVVVIAIPAGARHRRHEVREVAVREAVDRRGVDDAREAVRDVIAVHIDELVRREVERRQVERRSDAGRVPRAAARGSCRSARARRRRARGSARSRRCRCGR